MAEAEAKAEDGEEAEAEAGAGLRLRRLGARGGGGGGVGGDRRAAASSCGSDSETVTAHLLMGTHYKSPFPSTRPLLPRPPSSALPRAPASARASSRHDVSRSPPNPALQPLHRAAARPSPDHAAAAQPLKFCLTFFVGGGRVDAEEADNIAAAQPVFRNCGAERQLCFYSVSFQFWFAFSQYTNLEQGAFALYAMLQRSRGYKNRGLILIAITMPARYQEHVDQWCQLGTEKFGSRKKVLTDSVIGRSVPKHSDTFRSDCLLMYVLF